MKFCVQRTMFSAVLLITVKTSEIVRSGNNLNVHQRELDKIWYIHT